VRYAVLLSGGVDSSTALAELAPRGSVTAFYLKVWLEDELAHLGTCPWEEDLSYARAVCDRLAVELRVIPLQVQYFERVVEYTLSELRAGRTPSPDVLCNSRIKFGSFLDALERSGDLAGETRIGTGHYARIVPAGDHVLLSRSPDPVKDQTYFLSHLTQEQLRRIEFPIGTLTKEEVRRRAADLGLPTCDRPDSQGICFLGRVRYTDFIRHYLGECSGPIVELGSGRRLGEHRGYWFYTIGQRQGLGLAGGPWYVVAKDVERNVVLVSAANDAGARARDRFRIRELHWTWRPPGTSAGEPVSVHVKLRHGPALIPAVIEAEGPDTLLVRMDAADRGVAPGQFAVLYQGEICLGGGKIQEE